MGRYEEVARSIVGVLGGSVDRRGGPDNLDRSRVSVEILDFVDLEFGNDLLRHIER